MPLSSLALRLFLSKNDIDIHNRLWYDIKTAQDVVLNE